MGFHPCGYRKSFPFVRLSHLKLVIAEGCALSSSAVAAAKSVSFSNPLMFLLPILNSFCGVVYPLFFHRCGCGSAFVPMLEVRRVVIFFHPVIPRHCGWIYGLAFRRCRKKYTSVFRSKCLRRPIFNFSPPRMLTIHRWGWNCWIILLFYAFSTIAIPSVIITCCQPLTLARSPVFGTRSPGVSTMKLDRPLHSDYAPWPGRLIVALSPFR